MDNRSTIVGIPLVSDKIAICNTLANTNQYNKIEHIISDTIKLRGVSKYRRESNLNCIFCN